jgi:hypothetical protein
MVPFYELISVRHCVFSDQNNWNSGPMYDTFVYFAADVDPGFVESRVLRAGNLSVWSKVEKPQMLKTILEIEGLPPVGLVHCYHAAKREQPFACYSVAIYRLSILWFMLRDGSTMRRQCPLEYAEL